MCSKLAIVFSVLTVLATASPTVEHSGKTAKADAQAHEEDPSHWSYTGQKTGPANWGKMNPAFALCAEGKQQSPINIGTSVPMDLPPLKFSYGLSKLQILNNGHTIQINVEPGNFLEALGERYELKQFHFHTPSEEAIRGKNFPLVAHMVHMSETGKLAVVAVLFKEGQGSALLDALWPRMPSEHGESRAFSERMISPAALLPDNVRYYTFDGSLTTPPCSEGVRWLVLKTPTDVSKAQIARFRQVFPMNARPTQPLWGREVLESQ